MPLARHETRGATPRLQKGCVVWVLIKGLYKQGLLHTDVGECI